MMFTAAVVLISFVSCISEEIRWKVMPPDHQSLQHLTFLEVLHVEQVERGLEPKTDKTLPRMSSLANLAVQGPGIVLQALMSFELPDALKDKYKDDSALGSGTFGVFKVGNDWATPGTCQSAACKGLISSSASECVDTQRIHSADDLDNEASDHVVKCLYDGITGQTAYSQPYYIEMSFAGRDDVDKWWGKKLKEPLVADAVYVQHLKSVSKGVYLGLRFMAESKSTNQWVHMDLKPQNMVINEDTGQTVIVDMGTVVCQGSRCPRSVSGTTPIFRPPEVPHLSLFQPEVEWQKPVWSFDVHSAALSILGMATDGNSGLVMPGKTALHAVPVLPYLLSSEVQNSMANWATVQEVVDCGRKIAFPGTQAFLNGLLKCTNVISVVQYKKLFDQRLEAIRTATGNKRKAAWASLVHCRTSKRFATTLYPLPDMKATKVPKFFWTLVDDWMKTGFDEVIRKLQQQSEAVQREVETRGAFPWKINWQYFVDNSPVGFRGQYSQGRSIVELLLLPSPDPRMKNNLLNKIGPLNLAAADTFPGLVLRSLPQQPRGTDQPNVGYRCSIHTLEEECRFNPGKLEKIRRLAQAYSCWRSIRGDGNCYYRTVIFGALEALMVSEDHERLNQIMLALRQVQLETVPEQKRHNQLLQIMRTWRSPHQIEQWIAQDAALDQALIRACRRLVRQFLMKRAHDRSPSGLTYDQLVKALDSKYTCMEDFCKHVVDPLGRDAETLALDALPQQLGVGLRMWILDRRDEVSLISLDTPGPQGEVDVHVLFKPGHYDLLYPGPRR
eukprot:s1912_g2.t1